MNELQALGYIGVGGNLLDEWRDFGGGLLGMQVVDSAKSRVTLRMDDRKQRFIVDKAQETGTCVFGWEVADSAALSAIAGRLEAAGVRVKAEPKSVADDRFVAEVISFSDPGGNRVEVFHGAMIADDPFQPGRSISGFRTGALGLGHAVLLVPDVEKSREFYQDVMGFKVSDYIEKPFKAYFFHINGRHHSLALIQGAENKIHHLMVELCMFDDVGQGYDLAEQRDDGVGVTLGRHTNDFMTSFYANTPSQFMIEYGWGGREIDPVNWEASELLDGPSMWGHERYWMPKEGREIALEQRLKAARDGIRQPVQVMDGNYNKMTGSCAWWDGLHSKKG